MGRERGGGVRRVGTYFGSLVSLESVPHEVQAILMKFVVPLCKLHQCLDILYLKYTYIYILMNK